ncbi:fumarylacetoacetate hydrolase family protein [Caulobacter sp. S45]|uniref:fumarylacetoacetate hydrolase family protein n=1 Tax=Caulobacter sp. S45 TaxID=1641861 RepID=UPI001C2D34E9|nr:fumarylacetoacetate hydrolase family protein [Caulobacter sp. S45]
MKLVKIERSGSCAEGVLDGETVQVLGGWRPGPADKAPFTLPVKPLAELQRLLSEATERVSLADVSLAVPIDPAAQIFCAGFNYRAHLTETRADEPTHPVIFKRTLDTLVAHGQPVIRPTASETLDYEGEIAIVIGRDGRHIPADQAMSYVSGYSCFMDGSVREYQKHSVTSGKNFWRTGSMGPWVVTADEVGSGPMTLETFVNGEERQASDASRMIFDIPTLIAYCSTLTWLRPGDVIATGTPGGVGSRMTPPCWLKAGDRVEVRIGGVGALANVVEDEA